MRCTNKVKRLAPHIYQFYSTMDGPKVAVVGGIHGNEVTGQEVVQTLADMISSGQYELARGTLLLVTCGNPLAAARGTRGSTESADLNRCFRSRVLNQSDGDYEERRARELARFISGSMFVLDLHATRLPSEPFVTWGGAPYTISHRSACTALGATRVLLDPHLIYTGPEGGCLDDWTARDGGTAICYETGWQKATGLAKQVLGQTVRLLIHLGVFQPASATYMTRTWQGDVYEMVRPLMYPTDAVCFGAVAPKNFMATHRQNSDSVIVFPKAREDWSAAEPPIGYLARKTK